MTAAARPLAEKPYLSWSEVTEYLSLSKNAIRCRMKRGSFPRTCYSTSLGELRFVRAEIDRWMADGAKDRVAESLAQLRQARPLRLAPRAGQPRQQRTPQTVSESRNGAGFRALGSQREGQ